MKTFPNYYGNNFDDYCKRQAIAWAAMTLRQANWPFDAVEGEKEAWDVLTPDGWEGVNTWREFVAVAIRARDSKTAKVAS
jgi:hypothetical protein